MGPAPRGISKQKNSLQKCYSSTLRSICLSQQPDASPLSQSALRGVGCVFPHSHVGWGCGGRRTRSSPSRPRRPPDLPLGRKKKAGFLPAASCCPSFAAAEEEG